MRPRKRPVAPGHVFRRLGGGGGLWVVTAVRPDGIGAIHVSLVRADDPNTTKTLALSAVLDVEQFVRVADTAA